MPTVGPRGILRGRLYSGTSIAYALALALRLTQAQVHDRVSPWRSRSAANRWRSVRRWSEAALAGLLWPLSEPMPKQIEDLVGRLAALAPDGGGGVHAELAFFGAAQI